MDHVHHLVARSLLLLLFGWSPVWAIGDYGPATCMEGFVWREACGPADKVCVRPGVRDQARADNAETRGRVSPTDRTYGPDTCVSGFVWREACGSNDHVCVKPEVRSQAADDNAQRDRRLKYPYCRDYARDAVNAQRVNELYRCDLSGNRWQATENAHFQWCLGSPDRDIGGERFARYKELDRCSSTAGKTAREGKSFPDAPPPPSGPRCCVVPGPTGAFYTCGPLCP